jgi:phosphoserine phosphatase RsbU/P
VPAQPPLTVQATLAGRAFSTVSTADNGGSGGARRLWVPLVDDTERLGVAEVTVNDSRADADDLITRCEAFVGLIGHLVAIKLPYGDSLHQIRRTRTMSPAGELLQALLPPSTYTCERLVISALLEPAYDVGGDVYDYSVDANLARRDGQDLPTMATAGETALTEQFTDLRVATAVLAELDLVTGQFR